MFEKNKPKSSCNNCEDEKDPSTSISSSWSITKARQAPPKSEDIRSIFENSKKVKSDKRQTTVTEIG